MAVEKQLDLAAAEPWKDKADAGCHGRRARVNSFGEWMYNGCPTDNLPYLFRRCADDQGPHGNCLHERMKPAPVQS